MAVTIPNTFSNGFPAIAAEVNANFAAVKAFVDAIQTGVNIDAGAITNAQLATISTAGKVTNSATTAASANTANAIVTRDASGDFSAGAITATSVSAPNLPKGVVSYTYNTTAYLVLNTAGVPTVFHQAPAFTPIAGRLYRLTYTIGYISKSGTPGGSTIQMRKDSVSGTIIAEAGYFGSYTSHFSTSLVLTSAKMGTSSFVPTIVIDVGTAGFIAENTFQRAGSIVFEDIGPA